MSHIILNTKTTLENLIRFNDSYKNGWGKKEQIKLIRKSQAFERYQNNLQEISNTIKEQSETSLEKLNNLLTNTQKQKLHNLLTNIEKNNFSYLLGENYFASEISKGHTKVIKFFLDDRNNAITKLNAVEKLSNHFAQPRKPLPTKLTTPDTNPEKPQYLKNILLYSYNMLSTLITTSLNFISTKLYPQNNNIFQQYLQNTKDISNPLLEKSESSISKNPEEQTHNDSQPIYYAPITTTKPQDPAQTKAEDPIQKAIILPRRKSFKERHAIRRQEKLEQDTQDITHKLQSISITNQPQPETNNNKRKSQEPDPHPLHKKPNTSTSSKNNESLSPNIDSIIK